MTQQSAVANVANGIDGEPVLTEDAGLVGHAIDVCAAQLEFSGREFMRALQDLRRLLEQDSGEKHRVSLNSTLCSRKVNELSIRVSAVQQVTAHIFEAISNRGGAELKTYADEFLQSFGDKLAIVLEWCLFEGKPDSEPMLVESVGSLIDDLTEFISRCRDRVRSDLLKSTFAETRLVTLREVAALTNLSVPTLRRYKKKNLLPEPTFRGAGTQPDRWDASEVTRRLREKGKLSR